MSFIRRNGPTMAILVLLCLAPAVAFAQDRSLRVATVAASAAAAADWASTYDALKYYRVRESNPLLRPFDSMPGRMVSLGAVIDAGAIGVWNVTMGKSHPKVAVVGLWAMTAFRAYLTIHNIQNERTAARR